MKKDSKNEEYRWWHFLQYVLVINPLRREEWLVSTTRPMVRFVTTRVIEEQLDEEETRKVNTSPRTKLFRLL